MHSIFINKIIRLSKSTTVLQTPNCNNNNNININRIQRRNLRFFYNLLTASRTISNTYAQAAPLQLCANHMQHIQCKSHATHPVQIMCNTSSANHVQHIQCQSCATHPVQITCNTSCAYHMQHIPCLSCATHPVLITCNTSSAYHMQSVVSTTDFFCMLSRVNIDLQADLHLSEYHQPTTAPPAPHSIQLPVVLSHHITHPQTTTTTSRSTSVNPPRLSFSSQPCHPSLPASSLWGPRCPPPADHQMCQPVLQQITKCASLSSSRSPNVPACPPADHQMCQPVLQQITKCASLSSSRSPNVPACPPADHQMCQPVLQQITKCASLSSSRSPNVPACPPADHQMCQPVFRHSFCHALVPTKPNR